MTVTNTNTSRLRSGRGASLLAKEHTVLSHICRVPDREGGGNHTLALAYGMEIWKLCAPPDQEDILLQSFLSVTTMPVAKGYQAFMYRERLSTSQVSAAAGY